MNTYLLRKEGVELQIVALRPLENSIFDRPPRLLLIFHLSVLMNVNLRHKVSQLANDDQMLFGYVANMKNGVSLKSKLSKLSKPSKPLVYFLPQNLKSKPTFFHQNCPTKK